MEEEENKDPKRNYIVKGVKGEKADNKNNNNWIEEENEEAELSILRAADYVICVSKSEKAYVEQKLDTDRVFLWAHPHAVKRTTTPFDKRSNLLFVGGFKSAPAHNDDAVIYFVKKIFPKVKARIRGCRLIVAGSNPPETVKRLASDSIIVTGYVKDLKELYEKCRVFVAPIRFGAGVMWKVTETMSYGLPCVLSALAAQGIHVTDGEEALVAYDDKDFIEKTVRLYRDKKLWGHIRKRELDYVSKNHDPDAMTKELDSLLRKIRTNAEYTRSQG